MTTRNRLALAGLTLLLLAVSFASGRYSAPTKVRMVEHVTERASTTAKTSVETATAVMVQTREVTRWRTQIVTRPDGTKIETREASRDDGKREQASEKKAETHFSAQTRELVVTKERVTEYARPSWSVGVSAGLGLDMSKRLQIEASRRLFGQVSATATVDVPSHAGLIGLRLEF